MKKISMKVFVAFVFMSGATFVNAQEGRILKEVFKGEKASDSYKNPCKGETIRTCATRQTEVEMVSMNVWTNTYLYREIVTTYNGDGTLIGTTTNDLELSSGVDPIQNFYNIDSRLYPNAIIDVDDIPLTPLTPPKDFDFGTK